MASGGQNQRNPKTSASEPRQRSSWQRTTSMSDRDDNVSLNSFPNDLRPNNWEFSDWKPGGTKDQPKRRKKGNPEWEREQSLTQDSPPPSKRQHATPRSYPRTKITSTTPPSERQALENIRQAITFSDQEDGVSNDGERNNERNLLRRRENFPGYRSDVGTNMEPPLTRPVPNRRDDRNNRNNNKQNQNDVRAATGKPDSSQIVGRLMQIRDYIKQASSMMDSLRKSGDPSATKRCYDISQLISSWRESEQEYLHDLHVIWPGYRDEMDRLQKLMDHLKEQERAYTGVLQTILSVKEEPDVNDASRDMTPSVEPLDDTRSVDLDVQSEASEREARSLSAASRPRIEDKLGLTSDNDIEDDDIDGVQSETSDNSSNMDDTVIARRRNQDWENALGESELAMGGVNNPKEAAETLIALREQQQLLQKLIEQQEQMRALKSRQAALLAMQQEAETKLALTKQKSNEARSLSNAIEEAAISMTNRVDSLSGISATSAGAESNATRQQQTDPELLDIRQQLQYLRNELKSQDQNLQQAQAGGRNLQSNKPKDIRPKTQPPPRPPSPKFAERPQNQREPRTVPDSIPPTEMTRDQLQMRLQELLGKKDRLDQLIQEEFSAPMLPMPTSDMNRDELQNKLRELQDKKKRMDVMLQELQSLRSNPALMLNNAGATAPTPPPSEVDPVAASIEGTENLSSGVIDLLDAKQKLQKLNEVKDKLSQLKSLVHFYQSTEVGVDGRQIDAENQSSLPAYSDYSGENEPTRDRGPERDTQQVKPMVKSQVNRQMPLQPAVESDDEMNSSSSSSSSSSTDGESESQLSSLGPWGDDPEIQEKVRKLKEAKEKLKHLQNLVAIVQQPGMTDELPSNLAEIAASMEDVESTLTQPDNNNASEGEIPVAPERDSYYQQRMEEQMNELEELKNEKTRLLTIQSQLQTLHDRYTQAESGRKQDEDEDSRTGTRPKSPTETTSNTQQQDAGQQQSGGPSVTFSSNDEVYYKMRNQRMLREELRDKKKQLESIMKKDRNKKQYYKNQDNQSDTVSYSTEMFGIGASVDQTMATWGGSTVDNLESITEDGAGQDNDDDDEDEDDAYPIDGILQVEEEEEENQSDNETYTIEDDVRQRRKARAMAKSNNQSNIRSKTKRSFPRPSRQDGARPKEAWTGAPDFNKWSRNGRKSRQENFRSAEDIVQDDEGQETSKTAVEELQRKLEETSMLCQSLLGDSQPMGLLSRQQSAGFGSHNQLTDLQQQLQQQQLMMSLNQCYQQISLQQMEMQNMQRQMQALVYQLSDGDINESGFSDSRMRSLPSLISPMLPRQSPNLLMPGDAFQFNPVYQHASPTGNRLLRRAAEADTPSARSDLTDGTERQRRSSRQSTRDTYSQRMKKKSMSPPQMNNAPIMRSKTQSVQTLPEPEEEEEEDDDDESFGFSPDRESFENYLARKRREFFQRNKLQEQVQKQAQDTGQKRVGKSSTYNSTDSYRPGLSAGISGAGYAEDGRSVTSSIQSSLAAVSQANKPESVKDEEDPTEMSLFETLRETIYSEVATLISQNENRPHYLIELFRELQLLNTDYLRQRVLYDIKDVVSKYLVEENSISAPPPPWLNTASGNFTNTELTPSESNVTSDDEEIKYLLQTKLKEKVAANLVAKERQRTAQLLRAGSLKDDKYDYQEQAEITSSVSTPSNSYWDSPFNQDSLGETAIHLDKTLEKMREIEKRLDSRNEKGKSNKEPIRSQLTDVSSSAMDQGDESSVNSDSVPYPRIDTEQLDQQIKSIMTEVIPVIKEHMDNMCSPQLLAYIKRLVLSLTRQYGNGQEFARFFNRQLGTILQDTLAKYEGRKMRECGEDLLVDMSEALFNELAFFRLMQDLDDPLIAEKMKKAQALSDSEENTEDGEGDKDSDNESDTTETSTANASDNQDETRPTQGEQEDLGKARDDEFANEVEVQDAEDKDDDPENSFKGVQIELAPSETKPYTRIGSDEDDESADDESQSNEDPSETAVSINAQRMDSQYTDDNDEDSKRQDGTAEPEEDAVNNNGQPVVQQGQDQGKDADQGASSGKVETPTSPEHMNGDILNGDIEVITMDDLPPSLTVMSSEDLQQKLVQEQQNTSGTAAVLETMEVKEELVGDPEFLKEPDETSC